MQKQNKKQHIVCCTSIHIIVQTINFLMLNKINSINIINSINTRGHIKNVCQFSLYRVTKKPITQVFSMQNSNPPTDLLHRSNYSRYTYIHNWSLQPFSQDYDLAFHTTYIVCVNFILDLQFKVFSEGQSFKKKFMAIIGQYNPLVRTTLILYMSGGTYSLKLTPKNRFFKNFFMAIIDYYNPLVRTTTQLLTPLVLCVVILYLSGGTYSLKLTPKNRFFKNLFMAISILLSEFLP